MDFPCLGLPSLSLSPCKLRNSHDSAGKEYQRTRGDIAVLSQVPSAGGRWEWLVWSLDGAVPVCTRGQTLRSERLEKLLLIQCILCYWNLPQWHSYSLQTRKYTWKCFTKATSPDTGTGFTRTYLTHWLSSVWWQRCGLSGFCRGSLEACSA